MTVDDGVERAAPASATGGTDETTEVEETAEEAVIAKEARVVEEIDVIKHVGTNVETVTDTVHRTEIDVDDDVAQGVEAVVAVPIGDRGGESAAIPRELERRESFTATGNGVPMAELVPLRRRRFVPLPAASSRSPTRRKSTSSPFATIRTSRPRETSRPGSSEGRWRIERVSKL